MKIFLTRHGQTDWNVIERLQGQTDIELNDEGRQQAEETGELIKDENIDLIITSPLKRAKETAEIIKRFIEHALSPKQQWLHLVERRWSALLNGEKTSTLSSYTEI